jgi:putative ABC transport system permease protein
LKSGGTNVSFDRSGIVLRQLLIGLEVGLTALLLIIAGTLTTSLIRVLGVQKGFNADRVLTLDVSLPPQRYGRVPDRLRFYDEVRSAVRALPGVRDAAWVSRLPLEGQADTLVVNVPGAVEESYENLMANYRFTSPGYFRTVGIPLVRGRVYTEDDRGKNIAVISQNVARLVWPNDDPLGKQFHPGPDNAPLTQVVGIVGDIRTVRLDQPPVSMVYMPYWGDDTPKAASLVLRAGTDQLASMAGSVRGTIAKVDADVPVLAVRTMEQIVSDSVAGRRFQMLLAHSFAVVALFLAVLGIYSVVAYAVEQRRYEIGIRMALGATPANLRRLVVVQTMTPVLIGLVVGIISAFLAGRLLTGLFFGVAAADPPVIVVVACAMCAVAAIACYIPAIRIQKVNPIVALRAE